MIRRELLIDDRSTPWRVLYEGFADAAELDAVVSSRPVRSRTQRANDRLLSDADARGRLLGTVPGPNLDDSGGCDRDGLRVREEELLDREEHDVSGDLVDVPLFLSGEPECMVRTEPVPAASRIIHMAVSVAVPWSRTADEMRRAGAAVVRTVSRLERMGYRVAVDAIDTFCDRTEHMVLACGVRAKPEWTPLDAGRLMYFLADASFPRTAMFTWALRNPAWTDPDRMGVPMEHAFMENGTPSGIVRMLFGANAVAVSTEDLMGRAEPETWLEALLTGGGIRSELAGTHGREPLVLHRPDLPADPGHLVRGESRVHCDLLIGAVLLHIVEYAVQVLVPDAHLLLVGLPLPEAGGRGLGHHRLRNAYQTGHLADLGLVEVR